MNALTDFDLTFTCFLYTQCTICDFMMYSKHALHMLQTQWTKYDAMYCYLQACIDPDHDKTKQKMCWWQMQW